MSDVCRKFTLGIFLATALCIALSDDFYFDGIRNYRRYSALLGVIPNGPEHKWPIIFTALAYPLVTICLLIIMIAVFQKLLPNCKKRDVVELAFKKYTKFCLISGVLLIHYLSCDFIGDRWYLLQSVYGLNHVEKMAALYDGFHELVPWIYCSAVLMILVAQRLFAKRARDICGFWSSLLLIIGLCFMVFDLWFQPWAVFPIVVSIVVTSGAVAWMSLLSGKER